MRYGGFWRRGIALLIDTLLFFPLSFLFVWNPLGTWQRMAYASSLSSLLLISYFVILHGLRGQSIGKMILGLKVQLADGMPITFRAAVLRYAPYMILTTTFTIIHIVALSAVQYQEYLSIPPIQRGVLLQNYRPTWSWIVDTVNYSWLAGEIITLLVNRRKRAVHDYLANTVVVRTSSGEPTEGSSIEQTAQLSPAPDGRR